MFLVKKTAKYAVFFAFVRTLSEYGIKIKKTVAYNHYEFKEMMIRINS